MISVDEFYERYPYPRPIDELDSYRRVWRDPARRRAEFHLYWPTMPYREDLSILIAGCGTSQAAKHAMRWPGAQVTGIDVSATSIGCTASLKRKYDLANLELARLAVERVDELGKTFDLVVCTGVLHHLADPDAGLRALRDVVVPGGALHLMVYAPYGRTGIYMLQELCRRLGIEANDDGIRDLAVALDALPPGHPLQTLLHAAPDFRHEAALADALLHPRDRAYSVPQLLDALAAAGLAFARWLRQAPYSARCGAATRVPQLARLPAAEQSAALELFRGTMVRHSAVAYRDAAPEVVFTGDAWRAYVPIRAQDTICVRERLPPGAAAVLINRGHTDRDIYVPVTAAEARVIDAIDGRRTAAELGGTADLFERLWLHDQIVVDAHA
jgi:SAM-dependent methyltransferase